MAWMNDPVMFGRFLYLGGIGLIVIGLYGVTARRNLIRILLSLAVLEAGVNLLLVAMGYRVDAAAPIFNSLTHSASMVDPIPQALVLTAIVIGVGVLALGLTLVIRVHRAYGTLDTVVLARHLHQPSGPSAIQDEAHNDQQTAITSKVNS